MTQPGKAAQSGVRILDLTQFEAGPCTEALAWLCEVVNWKIRVVTRRSRWRMGKPTLITCCLMPTKAACDLKSKEGLALVKRLAEKADVMLKILRRVLSSGSDLIGAIKAVNLASFMLR